MDGARRGLAAGLITQYEGLDSVRPGSIWAVATIPVVVALALSILRDFLIGHFSVDAIALISMSAALVLGESSPRWWLPLFMPAALPSRVSRAAAPSADSRR